MQQVGANVWNGASVNRGSLKQVVDEEGNQHGNGQVKTD